MSNGTDSLIPSGGRLRDLSTLVLAFVGFLIPVFFIPSQIFPFQFSKTLVALLGITLVIILLAARTFRTGALSFHWSWLMTALILLPGAYGLAAMFSPVPSVSLWGYQLEQDTFGFIALGAVLALVSVFALRSERAVFWALCGIFFSGVLALLFQLVQIFLGTPILPSLFTLPVANLVGSWNDFALFIALTASVALLALESLSLSFLSRAALGLVTLAALAALAIANFSLAWILLGIVSFIMLVFAFTNRARHTAPGDTGMRGVVSCLTLAFAVFFLFFGGNLSGGLQNSLGVAALDVRPSVEGTLAVLQTTYKEDAFFGTGPNTFRDTWLTARPSEVVSTPFWNVGFGAGFGSIPTAFVTGGLLVGAAWVIFGVLLLVSAFRALLVAPAGRGRSYVLIAATATGSLFLLIAHIFYVPATSLSLLMFLFTGLFLASLRETPLARPVALSFSESPRAGFLSVLILAVALVASFAALYGAGETYAGSVQEGRAIQLSRAGNLDGAIRAGVAAANLASEDRQYRLLTALSLARLQEVVERGASDQKAQSEFAAAFSDAVTVSAAAVSANPMNYENWMTRASVYESVVSLGIEGAYEKAVETLEEARKRNPASPEVDFHLATLKALKGNAAGARASAEAALAKKADYTAAILFIAELSLREGRLDDAIRAVNAAILFNPQETSLFYQRGLLELEAKEYQAAKGSFEAALLLTPDFANASFFLGQAKFLLGEKEESLRIFRELNVKNPANSVLESVIAAIEKDTNPFSQGTVAPAETVPSER